MFRESGALLVKPTEAETEVKISPEVQEKINQLEAFIHSEINTGQIPNEKIISAAHEIVEIFKSEGVVVEQERAKAFKKHLKKRLLEKMGGCVGCGGQQVRSTRHAPVIELHHIIPRNFGGQSDTKNALTVCRDCHVKIHG